MEEKKITELDQRILTYAIARLYKKYNTVDDLVKEWLLFGPCLERCPKPEVHRPWMVGLGLTDKS